MTSLNIFRPSDLNGVDTTHVQSAGNNSDKKGSKKADKSQTTNVTKGKEQKFQTDYLRGNDTKKASAKGQARVAPPAANGAAQVGSRGLSPKIYNKIVKAAEQEGVLLDSFAFQSYIGAFDNFEMEGGYSMEELEAFEVQDHSVGLRIAKAQSGNMSREIANINLSAAKSKNPNAFKQVEAKKEAIRQKYRNIVERQVQQHVETKMAASLERLKTKKFNENAAKEALAAENLSNVQKEANKQAREKDSNTQLINSKDSKVV